MKNYLVKPFVPVVFGVHDGMHPAGQFINYRLQTNEPIQKNMGLQ